MSHRGCVEHVKKGQSVHLCIRRTTTPHVYTNEKKHFIIVTGSYWYKLNANGLIKLYRCSFESCSSSQKLHPSNLNYTHYPDASFICLLIENVQEYEKYRFSAIVQNPSKTILDINVDFHVTYEGM